MSSSEQSETFGTLTVQFRDRTEETITGMTSKEAGVMIDHLSKMMDSNLPALFAAIRRPDFGYAVDLMQVRSMNFAPDEDEDEAEGAAR